MAAMEKIFSVGQLTKSIRNNLLANNAKLKDVWIDGEISGWRPYPSGHIYFTLKDAEAQISAILFSFHQDGCEAAFRQAMAQGGTAVNGLRVQVSGELSLSMSQGRYSFTVCRVRLAGMGEKMAQFNALKAQLEKEGLNKLDHPELRRPLPFLPHRIGIVTSPAGAVIHDMCDVLTRRFPNIEIRLFPAKVQGDGAVETIVRGLAYFNGLVESAADWRPDVLIVGRGGGSTEDLWTFNEEVVVRAVAQSAVPVISAVGHESDVTLCDYVADLRAGTPSIAAERAVPVKAELVARVRDATHRLSRAPMRRVETWSQQLDGLSTRLAPALRDLAARMEMRLQRSALRMEPPLRSAWQSAAHRLERAQARLTLLDPSGVLQRGYSITLDEKGDVVQSAEAVAPGQTLTTRLKDGELRSRVLAKEG